jgi:hypothetical protein
LETVREGWVSREWWLPGRAGKGGKGRGESARKQQCATSQCARASRHATTGGTGHRKAA